MPEKDTTGLLAANSGQLLYAKRRPIAGSGRLFAFSPPALKLMSHPTPFDIFRQKDRCFSQSNNGHHLQKTVFEGRFWRPFYG